MAFGTVVSGDNVIEVDFGRDTYCVDSLRTGRLASGVRLVAQNAYHRLTTPRGMLRGGEDEQDYGLDLTEEIGKPDTESAALPGKIRAELLKDERISEVAVSMTVTRNGPATEYEITIEAKTDEGPFELVLVASEVTVELLKLEAA